MKIKGANPEGTEVEIDVADGMYLVATEVAESHIPKEVVGTNYVLKAEANQNAAAARRDTKEKLVGDDDFLAEIADSKSDFFRERLEIKAPDTSAELDRITATVEEQKVKPLQERLDVSEAFSKKLLGKSLQIDVSDACRDLKVRPGMVELLKTYFRDRTQYDADHDGFFVVGGDGKFSITTDHKENKAPYRTVVEELAAIKAAGNNGEWFEDGVVGGAGYKGAGEGDPTDDTTVEGLKAAIAKLEADGKYTEAAPLKTKLALMATGRAT